MAARFNQLLGLKVVPFGILLLLLAPAEWVLPETREALLHTRPSPWLRVSVLVIAIGLPLAIAGYWLISRWYQRNYGRVEQTRRQRTLGRVMAAATVLLILVPTNLEETLWISGGQSLPVNVACFTVAAVLLAYWWLLGRFLTHYVVIAAIALALGVLSLAGLPPAEFIWHLRESTLFLGLAAIAGGVLDHRALAARLVASRNLFGVRA